MIRVKICGITNEEDAQAALEAGADYLGFIQHPASPRYIPPERIAQITAAVRALEGGLRVRCVGVFVNETPERVREICNLGNLELAQLHGDEGVDALIRLRELAFKAIRPPNLDAARTLVETFSPWGPLKDGPQLLIDAFDPRAFGGTGVRADWGIAAQVAKRVPKLMLAGGLDPQNVAAAIRVVRPWGVDVSSGVERAPGLKDHDKVRAFVAAARAASQEGGSR